MSAPLLEARGVGKRYGNRPVLDGVDLAVARGEFVVVLGASGCGKSTLLGLLAGFDAPDGGAVLLDGRPVTGPDRRTGFVFQSYALFPWLTVEENVAFGPSLRGAVDPARVRDLLRTVGVEGFDSHYPAALSGGMRQRVALARTLANDPEVLLCDEPFAALDAMTRQLLQEEISRIVRDDARTCVFVTHSIDEALLLGDRIVVLSARPGRVKAEIRNDLPHPRDATVRSTPRWRDLHGEIWTLVKEEVLVGLRGA